MVNRLVDPQPGDHVLVLLGALMDRVRAEVESEMTRAEAQPGATRTPRLRSSQMRLLSLTPEEGMRAGDLAARAGMTKQSLGELAGTLEDRGLLESVGDPGDRRVRVIRPTALGLSKRAADAATIAGVESGLRAAVGGDDWDAMRALLVDLARRLDGRDDLSRRPQRPGGDGR